MTCIEFAFHPVCLRRKRKMPGVSCVSCAVLFSTVSSACESMCTTVPTMLPIRKAPLSLMVCVLCSACECAENAGRLFRRAPCRASALSSPRSAIFRLASGASPLQLHGNLRAVSLVSRHFPRLHGALSSSPASLAALCVASALTAIRHHTGNEDVAPPVWVVSG